MHSAFTWLGCGAFAPRWKVQNFLAQLGSAGLGKDRLRLADMYFSIWTNQYPWQLSNPLNPLDQKEGWSDAVDQWAIVYQNVVSINAGKCKTSQIWAKNHFWTHLFIFGLV